jgi:hypothetical protein
MLDIQIYEIVSTKTKKGVNRTRVAAPGISLEYQSLGLRPLCSTAYSAFLIKKSRISFKKAELIRLF